jgi:hypothetical protein
LHIGLKKVRILNQLIYAYTKSVYYNCLHTERKEEKIVDNLTGGMLKRVTRRVTFKKIIVYRRKLLENFH